MFSSQWIQSPDGLIEEMIVNLLNHLYVSKLKGYILPSSGHVDPVFTVLSWASKFWAWIPSFSRPGDILCNVLSRLCPYESMIYMLNNVKAMLKKMVCELCVTMFWMALGGETITVDWEPKETETAATGKFGFWESGARKFSHCRFRDGGSFTTRYEAAVCFTF